MITILKKIIITLAIIIVIDQVFSYFFIEYIFKKTISGESGGTINYVINKKRDLDFLILGASRAKNGINPSILTSLGKHGYNLGINGTIPINSLLILDILIQNGTKPKSLILQTDLANYITYSDKDVIDQIRRVYPYDTELTKEYVNTIGYTEKIKYFFGFYRLNRKIPNILYNFIKKDSTKDDNGYVGLPDLTNRPDIKYPIETYIYEPESLNAKAIKKIKEICDKNNIKLILVFSPSYKNSYLNKKQQEILVKDLRENMITNIVDLSDIHQSKTLEQEENWRDGIHLNARGSQKFSTILNEALKKYYK